MGALIRYHGGKTRIADKIVSMFPSHDCYVEPFGGGAAVLLAKPRSRLEIYNDMDCDMVALFRTLRDHPKQLADAVALTPFARDEFELSMTDCDDDLEKARRVLIRSHMGHGGTGTIWRTGFAKDRRNGVVPVDTWMALPAVVRETAERMLGVVIENREAQRVLLDHDAPGALHYVDPPYLHETRGKHRYRFEMTTADHERLLSAVRKLKGSVVLSGYSSGLYDAALHDWTRVEIKARADKAIPKTEVIWTNFCDAAPLFAAMKDA